MKYVSCDCPNCKIPCQICGLLESDIGELFIFGTCVKCFVPFKWGLGMVTILENSVKSAEQPHEEVCHSSEGPTSKLNTDDFEFLRRMGMKITDE